MYLFLMKFQRYMLYFMYHVSCIMISICSTWAGVSAHMRASFQTVPFLSRESFHVCEGNSSNIYGGNSFNISYPNSSTSPSRSKGSYRCTFIKCGILPAKIFSMPFMCSKVTLLILAFSVLQLFTFEFSVCAVRNICNGVWSHLKAIFA